MTRALNAARLRDASYHRAVIHIALNDDPAESKLERIRELATVALVADVWQVSTRVVAMDVKHYRDGSRSVGARVIR